MAAFDIGDQFQPSSAARLFIATRLPLAPHVAEMANDPAGQSVPRTRYGDLQHLGSGRVAERFEPATPDWWRVSMRAATLRRFLGTSDHHPGRLAVRPRNGGDVFRYRLHSPDGDDLGEATYAMMIKPGEEIHLGCGPAVPRSRCRPVRGGGRVAVRRTATSRGCLNDGLKPRKCRGPRESPDCSPPLAACGGGVRGNSDPRLRTLWTKGVRTLTLR